MFFFFFLEREKGAGGVRKGCKTCLQGSGDKLCVFACHVKPLKQWIGGFSEVGWFDIE